MSRTRDGAPGGNRTPDRRIRNPLLYPSELQALNEFQARPWRLCRYLGERDDLPHHLGALALAHDRVAPLEASVSAQPLRARPARPRLSRLPVSSREPTYRAASPLASASLLTHLPLPWTTASARRTLLPHPSVKEATKMRPWSVFVRHEVVSLQVLARSHRGSLGRPIRCDRRGARCDRSGGPLQAIGRGARGDPAGAFQFSTLPPAAYGFADSASSLIDTTGGPSISSDLTSVGALDRARHRFPVLEQSLWDTTSVLPLWRLDLGPTRGPGSRRGATCPASYSAPA